ncbi:hypothetical protein FACS1894151_09780 [Spirochaetia bacterium]|nr:hypothetical protein FACS1894151_09780 [Spirochaetia bacterium]
MLSIMLNPIMLNPIETKSEAAGLTQTSALSRSVQRLAVLGTAVPEILLPQAELDLQKWAVIACDQFTQDEVYWDAVARETEKSPSTLELILPEIYLEKPMRAERIAAIHQTMQRYLDSGVFRPPLRSAVYLERSTPFRRLRRGLLAAIDLECYDWTEGTAPLIRATEGVVRDRLPPRVDVRRNAALELPHILLLINDPEDTLIPALGERARKKPPLYDTPLMLNSGHVSGWPLDSPEDWDTLAAGLEKLAGRSQTHTDEHGSEPGCNAGSGIFLYAVGDGNHSLASAKAVWEEYKAAHGGNPQLMEHPARWALAELENIHDPGIVFEPIHRVLFGANLGDLTAHLGVLPGFSQNQVKDRSELVRQAGERQSGRASIGLIAGTGLSDEQTADLTLVSFDSPLMVTPMLQPLLDSFAADKRCRIDYIHGEDELFRLSTTDGNIGILLPPVDKTSLFETVERSGSLPRKSFSMGEAEEKRFYLESRKLF